MSRTWCPWPLTGALTELETILGPRVWVGINPTQEDFLSKAFLPGRDQLAALQGVDGLSMDYLAATTAAPLNQFFKDHGFADIHFNEFSGNEVGAASVMRAALQWAVSGFRTEIETPGGKTFSAFGLREDTVSFLSSYGRTVACLATTNEDLSVYITPFDGGSLPEKDTDLAPLARSLVAGAEPTYSFEMLIMPMVDLDHRPDVSWLLGMRSVPWFVAQAIQQTRLKLNEFGFVTESAGGISTRKGPGTPFCVQEPFLAWIEYTGISQPLLVAHVTEEAWKDPGTLDLGGGKSSDPHISNDGGEAQSSVEKSPTRSG